MGRSKKELSSPYCNKYYATLSRNLITLAWAGVVALMKLVSPGMSMDYVELRASVATTTTHKISYFIDFPGLCSSSSSSAPHSALLARLLAKSLRFSLHHNHFSPRNNWFKFSTMYYWSYIVVAKSNLGEQITTCYFPVNQYVCDFRPGQ